MTACEARRTARLCIGVSFAIDDPEAECPSIVVSCFSLSLFGWVSCLRVLSSCFSPTPRTTHPRLVRVRRTQRRHGDEDREIGSLAGVSVMPSAPPEDAEDCRCHWYRTSQWRIADGGPEPGDLNENGDRLWDGLWGPVTGMLRRGKKKRSTVRSEPP